MKGRIALFTFILVSLVVACYGAANSWNGRWILTHSPGTVREALRESSQLHQNYLFPGCGNGREKAHLAHEFLDGLIKTDPQVVRKFLGDPDPSVRAAAALSLGWRRDQASLSPIYDLVEHEPDRQVRADAAGALARLDTSGIRADLNRLAASSDEWTRVCAYVATGGSLDKSAVAWLEGLSSTSSSATTDYLTRKLATIALWKRRHPDDE